MQTIFGVQWLTTLDQLPWLTAVYLGFVGGCIGSFLNVVAYRMPLGMSLLRPGSHCPTCKHPIRMRDNIPVCGWVLLKGRCRDCKAQISGRYPAIEAIAALAFGILWWTDIDQRREWVDSSTVRFTLFALHALLISTLLAIGLIDFDGKRTPLRLVIPCCLVGGWVFWALPEVIYLMNPGPAWTHPIFGAAVGLVLGGLVEPAQQGNHRWNRFVALTLVGTWLSVVAVSVIVLSALGTTFLMRRMRPTTKRSWFLPSVFLGVVVWIVLNSRQIEPQLIGEHVQVTIVAGTIILVLVGTFSRRFWRPRKQTS